MLRGHVPPVQASKTRAIVSFAGKKNGPVSRACSLAKQASFFVWTVGTILEELQQN